MKEKERILWIDYTKSICIYLVLLGHTFIPQPMTYFIYTFHMPLFFFLSGCLFSFEKNPTFKEFIAKRFKRLMIPYLWINLITYLFWLSVGRKFGIDTSDNMSWYAPLKGIFLGYGKIYSNPPMWFFFCLFSLEIIYYFIFKPLKNNTRKIIIVLLTIAIAGYINYRFNPSTLPFYLGPAIVGIIFYGTGNLIVKKIEIKKIRPLHGVLILITFLTVLFISPKNGYVTMSENDYKNYCLFLIGSLAGIYLVCIIGNLLSLKPVFKNTIVYISKNTLLINGFHILMFSGLKGIMVFVLHIPLDTLYGTVIPNILFSIVALFLCLPLAYIINRYFPFIVGMKKTR